MQTNKLKLKNWKKIECGENFLLKGFTETQLKTLWCGVSKYLFASSLKTATENVPSDDVNYMEKVKKLTTEVFSSKIDKLEEML